MRILQVVPSLDVGGAERVAALLAREQQRGGHAVAVVSLFDPVGSWIERDLRAAGVDLFFLGKRPGLDVRMVPRLAGVLRRWRPDVVHTHLHVLKYLLPAALAARPLRVVHTLHNLAEREVEPQSQALQRVAFRGLVTPVAIGEAVAASMAPLYGAPARHVVANGIPTAASRAPPGTREALRAALHAADHPVLLSAGRLNPQKNHAVLIDAVADPRLARVHLWIAGEGELAEDLAARVRDRGVADRVRLLGVRTDVPALMAAADLFVLPSTWEGNPLVVMEAMAAGLPVVATAVGCVPELLSPDTGRLVPAGVSEALVTAIADLTADPATRGQLGAAARARATERFDVSAMAEAYLRVYAAAVPVGGPGLVAEVYSALSKGRREPARG